MSTYRIANIIVVSTNSERQSNFTSELNSFNFSVESCLPTDLVEKSKVSHPDLIIIDVSCDDYDGFDLTQNFKSSPEVKTIPVVLTAEEKTDDLYLRGIEVNADDIFLHVYNTQELIVHIKPLLRLSTMFLEQNKRIQLAKDFKAPLNEVIASDENNPYRILLIEPKDGDKATLETILEGNCKIDVCVDFFCAEDKLSTGFYDVAISNVDDKNEETVLGLCSRVRNNPRLFNLPMLLLSDGSIENRLEAYKRGATRIIARPLKQSSLKAKIIMLVRRQRQRWHIRNVIETTKQNETLDEISHAYTAEFLKAHLNKQVSDAHTRNKHLAVIFLSIPNVPGIRQQFGERAADHLLQQIFQWIGNLTRVEDLVARYDDHEFCIALPDTPLGEAEIVMHRIAGILSYTDFAIIDVFQAISVWVEVGISRNEPNDTLDDIIERARKKIS